MLTPMPARAGSFLCRVLALALALFSPSQVLAASLEEAERSIFQGEYVAAYHTIKELALDSVPEEKRRDALVLQGRLYLSLGDADKAQLAFDQALKISEKQGNKSGVVRALNGQVRL